MSVSINQPGDQDMLGQMMLALRLIASLCLLAGQNVNYFPALDSNRVVHVQVVGGINWYDPSGMN